jgi:hypothetical protein
MLATGMNESLGDLLAAAGGRGPPQADLAAGADLPG